MPPILGFSTPVKRPVCDKRKLTDLNPAIRKNREFTFLQTLNKAKMLWDPRTKPRGLTLLGGH